MQKNVIDYTKSQVFWLVLLRVFIGWHFLYEGLVKLFNSDWTSYFYLMDSQGFMKDFFQDIANNPTLLSVVDFLNVWGLVLVGLALIVGCLSRFASIAAIVLLVAFYLSHPPFVGSSYQMPTEGSYIWIDKNVIEMAALMVLLYFPTSQIIGLDRYIYKFFNKRKK